MNQFDCLPEPLVRLTGGLARLPGIGRRTAGRLALALLDWPPEALQELGERIARLRQEITACPSCWNLSAGGQPCVICADPRRNHRLVCVVENALQIPPIEASGAYRGVYHVLGGRIQPLEGKGPDDIRIAELRTRLQTAPVDELILATSSDVEGEATAAFLADEFADFPNLKISRIASGVPVGADLSFADSPTIAMAMNARRRLASQPS